MATEWHQKQKDRGARLILSWFKPRKCWKKFREGTTKYFHHPNSAAGYEAAVAEYHAWLSSLRDERPWSDEYHHHLDVLGKCKEWYDRFGVPDDEDELQEELARTISGLLVELESGDELPPLDTCLPDCVSLSEKRFVIQFCGQDFVTSTDESSVLCKSFGSVGYEPPEQWRERLRQLSTLETHQKKQPQTVGHQVDRFLAFKEKQVHAGVITARTWGTLAERLPYFLEWIKKGTHVSTIDGTTVTGFYEWVLSQPAWGHQRSKGIFNAARQWIRWAWRQDDVELEHLPRNIDSREFLFLVHLDDTGVTKKTRTDDLWTPADFQKTVDVVPEDFRLFLLLMLNCGFTNSDVAALLKSEVKIDEGRIIRQRSKTRRHTNPPVVNYKLWPTTLKLLQKYWSEHPTLALTNQRGNPLGVSKLKVENGETKETVWTSLGRRYGQMKTAKPKKKKKTELPDKQLKFLRKTGSTRIKSNQRYMSLDSIYLGHSWATVADKHYNAFDGQPYDPLDEALEWLGAEFGQVAVASFDS